MSYEEYMLLNVEYSENLLGGCIMQFDLRCFSYTFAILSVSLQLDQMLMKCPVVPQRMRSMAL